MGSDPLFTLLVSQKSGRSAIYEKRKKRVRPHLFQLQALQREFQYQVTFVRDQLRIPQTVTRFGIEHHLKRLACPLQFVGKLKRVLRMHVVVEGALKDEQLAMQIARGEA